ncbi:piggyBac transposable element-derived protein 3-like [Macrosteles quadrilineatus]|uniref:piggyBac transposable element-derived protein 3-like n=1 Tax=Macrosteles quadrilineatus TaxID=74068 RepID=UPI0023E12D01|nr:piggyBac transposable element-derived protein 3-like [Macrosteles quadrilineatus]
MSVNRFESIRQNLHFNDNSAMVPRGEPGHDRLHKLRPIVDALQSRFQTIPYEQMLCVDEQLCATKAHHYMKQYMPKKPHKWGYKLYVLSGVSGFAYRFEIYSGQENDPDYRLPGEPDLGSCANVVVRLVRNVPTNHHQLYFDNFYTTLPLMVHLEKRNIHALGTARRDRLQNEKLPSMDELKECPRGFSAETCLKIDEVEVTSVVWKDNKCVTLVSTYAGIGKQTKVAR